MTAVTLGQVTDNFDFLRRPVKGVDREAGPYPYYGASGIVDYVADYLLDGDYLLVAEDGENLRSRNTPIAFLASGKFWVNNHAHVVRANHLADTKYLSYALSATDISGYLSGSTLPKLTQGALNSIVLDLPDIATQRAIAEVLGALDDKIAANDRLAVTIDDFCQALFDQVAGTDSTTLSDIAVVNERSAKPGTGEIRYLDISSVSVGGYSWPARIRWSDAPGRARRLVRPGDTVWSTVRPNRRSHALVLDDGLIGSTGLAVITPTAAGPAFVCQATKTPQFTAYLEGVAEGSAYPAVRGERFLQAPVPDVSPESRGRFESVAYPARLRAHAASVESRHLAILRDTLLPHLMSGRITVRGAEKAVEEVL